MGDYPTPLRPGRFAGAGKTRETGRGLSFLGAVLASPQASTEPGPGPAPAHTAHFTRYQPKRAIVAL